MAQINKPNQYFNTKLYTGTGATASITGVGFQPDLSWLKMRSAAEWNFFVDSIRGANKVVWSNATNAEYDYSGDAAQILTTFNTDGFSLGTSAAVNGSGQTFASWNWKANGAGVANTAGATASTVSANTTAGFSIVKYTGAGATTYGHGLGATPNMIIIKKLNSVDDWFVYHHSIITASSSNKQFMRLNNTNALESNGTAYTFTSVSDTTFGVGTDDKISESGDSFIAYCFAEKKGFSKFGSYIGNGNNANGPFVYTGFKPAFVIFKRTSGTGNWQLLDNKRLGYNPLNNTLYPNTTVSEQDEGDIYLYSNGFQLRGTGTDGNGSGSTYIYMAFAEQPLVGTNNIPATAR